METKITKRILSNTEDVQFGYWDSESGEYGEFFPITEEDDLVEIARVLECSPKLVEAMVLLVASLTEAVCQDLADVWNRLPEERK